MEPDNKYHKEPFDNSGSPRISFSFAGKSSLILMWLGISLGISFLWPFVPSRHFSSNWKFPTSFNDYIARVAESLIIFIAIVVLILIGILIAFIRGVIDIKLGYLKVGVFKVVSVKALETKKYVYFSNNESITLTKDDHDFDTIATGQIVEIKRSATNRLSSYKILRTGD